ncbi:hypothetical protein [Sphaerimonospora thailandensis]|nr:hypothetical protein [Sphaerimonospora thailandensis]
MASRRGKRRLSVIAVVLLAASAAWCTASATLNHRLDELRLPRIAWEGGPAYYEKFRVAKDAGWGKSSFFPIGVWFESVGTDEDVVTDKAAGINTYVELTENSDMNLVRAHGLYALTSKPLKGVGSESVGWLITDEADMWGGPGDGVWTGRFPGEGEICDPQDARCGYTAMRTLKDRLPKGDGRFFYANYGKGVQVWATTQEAAKFVNSYTDVASADMYWYTDIGICSESQHFLKWKPTECPLAADYGYVVDRMRQLDALDGRRQPIYAFVELGWPGTNGKRLIEPQEAAGAVMNSLIHEARGIVYFNHSFGGPCPTQHLLREDCYAEMRSAVTEVNRRIAQLAPVLNTQSYRHTFAPGLDTMLKLHNGSCYVFSMVKRGAATGRHTLALPPELASAKEVEVLFENRKLPVRNGRVTDAFDAESTYHIYKITP